MDTIDTVDTVDTMDTMDTMDTVDAVDAGTLSTPWFVNYSIPAGLRLSRREPAERLQYPVGPCGPTGASTVSYRLTNLPV